MLYFEKSQPAPDSLEREEVKASGNYKCGDVVDRLKEDFKNKCYICEKVISDINVEHFKSHKGNETLKFDWNNLFWSCSVCNNIKSYKFDNLIDCTNINEDIEKRLRYSFYPTPLAKVVIYAIDNKESTKMTKELIEKVFNNDSTPLRAIGLSNKRKELLTEIQAFNYALTEYFDAVDDEDTSYFCRKIKKHLHYSSNFTSFKRWIVRDNDELFKEFKKYL